jgi:hypothetical protein
MSYVLKVQIFIQNPELCPINFHTFGEGRRTYESWAWTFKLLWSPGIDSKVSIPPAYVAWRAGTITLILLGS